MLNASQQRQVLRDQDKQRTHAKGLLFPLPHGVDTAFLPTGDACKTAHWHFDHTTGKHVIRVSREIDLGADRTISTKGLRPVDVRHGKAVVAYAGNLAVATARHEDAHARWTDRDFTAIRQGIKDASAKAKLPAPFSWSRLNLFEDARIEDRGRKATGSKYNWLKHEFSLPERYYLGSAKGEVTPDQLFLALIQAEKCAKHVAALESFCKGRPEKAAREFDKILAYYRKACLAKSTKALLPLIARFTLDFPEPEGTGTGQHGATSMGEGAIHGGDFVAAAAAAAAAGATALDAETDAENKAAGVDPADAAAELADAMSAKGQAEADKAAADETAESEKGAVKPDLTDYVVEADPEAIELKGKFPAATAAQRALEAAGDVPPAEIQTRWADDSFVAKGTALANRLAAALRGGQASRVATASATNRVRVRAIVSGSSRIFSGRAHRADGVPHVVVVYDASGSMCYDTRYHGRAFLYAMGLLERQGLIKLDVIISWGKDGMNNGNARSVHLNNAKHLTAKWLGQFEANGSWEGFAAALKVHDRIVRKADVLMAYTDGQINDTPWSRTYWKQRNLFALGFCCKEAGGVTKTTIEALNRYFDTAVVRATMEDLGKALLPYLRQKK